MTTKEEHIALSHVTYAKNNSNLISNSICSSERMLIATRYIKYENSPRLNALIIATRGARIQRILETHGASLPHRPRREIIVSIPDEALRISRRYTKQIRLASRESLIRNGNIKYRDNTKIWECMICHRKCTNYNRRQIINHVNTKHTALKSTLRTLSKRGAHIEKYDDRSIQMGCGYGVRAFITNMLAMSTEPTLAQDVDMGISPKEE